MTAQPEASATPPVPQKPPAAVALVGLLIALGIPEAVVLFLPHGLARSETIFWALTALVLLYVLFVEKRPLSSIGFRKPRFSTFGWAIVAAVVSVLGIGLIYGVVFRMLHLQPNTAAMTRLLALPWGIRLLLVLRAAIFEEIVYRGYAIERLTELTGNRTLAAVIALILFTVAHAQYWGFAQLLIAGFGGLVLTILYLWRRDLACNMLAHFLTDGSGFLLH
jgi:uncharacterized protein